MEKYNPLRPRPDKRIHASYKLLYLETFFTKRNKEVRTLTIKSVIFFHKAAGTIHSDMEQGFIKAEVYTVNELMQHKSEPELKDAGKII